MTRVAVILFSFAMGCLQAEPPTLHELQPVEPRPLICECTFNESDSTASEGSYGSGPEILVLDINSDSPGAYINLGAGDVLLPAFEAPAYVCEAGQKWRSTWRTESTILQVDLVASSPGAEACWFAGSATIIASAGESKSRIKGACGC